MKKPTGTAICSVGVVVSIAFLIMVAGVDLFIAPVIVAISGIGIYGHWLRNEEQIKFLMEIFERNGQQFTQDSPTQLRITKSSFSNLPGSFPGMSKVSP